MLVADQQPGYLLAKSPSFLFHLPPPTITVSHILLPILLPWLFCAIFLIYPLQSSEENRIFLITEMVGTEVEIP